MRNLVERDAALKTLRNCLADAATSGRVVLVTGEAGIGKTSVVRALAENHAPVWWGACDALHTPHPLAPLLDIARDQDVRFSNRLPGPRVQLFEAVLEELRSPRSTLLLVIEDVHWADEATLDLIKFVGRRIERTRALMVLTFRDDEVSTTHPLRQVTGELPAAALKHLPLLPLSPAGVELLARSALRAPADLFAATRGNPFFVTELLRHPVETVPRTVQDLVLSRVSRLRGEAQAVVRHVSIVPGRAERWLLEEMLAPSTEALEACLDSGLLVADATSLAFRHELARMAVESALPLPVAQSLHARMLSTLAGADRATSAARLAHHAALAGDQQAIARHAPAAALEARSRGAFREAALHLRTALAQAGPRPDEERRSWLEAYALDSSNVDWHDEAVAARQELDTLYARTGDVIGRSGNLSRLALLHVYMLRNAEADAASRRAIQLLEPLGPSAALATAYGVEASLRLLDRQIPQAQEWSRKSIALARQFDASERLCFSLSTFGMAEMFRDYEAGCRQLEEALAMAVAQDQPIAKANALLNLGTGAGELMRLRDARHWLQEAIACADEYELDGSLRYSGAWMALCELQAGHWSEAAERATQIAARPATAAVTRVMALVALGRVRVRRGDPGADEVLTEALELAAPANTLQRIAPVRAARAEAAYARGDLAATATEAQAALPLALQSRHPWFIGELAYWCWRAGVLDVAPADCAQPYALQIAGQWRSAAAAWEQLGCPYEQARALAEGDTAAQQDAITRFDALGGRPAADAVRTRLAGAGVRGVPRGARASTRAQAFGLTMRELQVLKLLCEGLHNGEIAERLCRSVRTVDHHLAAVYAKLGVGTRIAAIQLAQRAGLASQSGQPPASN